MHASTFFSVAVAALASVARAEVHFSFYEGDGCTDGAEAMTAVFLQDQTITFAKHNYRTIRIYQPESSKCSYEPIVAWDSVEPVTVVDEMSGANQVAIICRRFRDQDGNSLALEAVEVWNC